MREQWRNDGIFKKDNGMHIGRVNQAMFLILLRESLSLPSSVPLMKNLQRKKMKIQSFFLLPHQKDPNQDRVREIHLSQHHQIWCWIFLLQNLVFLIKYILDRARRLRSYVRERRSCSR
jgi:hypothetical protein